MTGPTLGKLPYTPNVWVYIDRGIYVRFDTSRDNLSKDWYIDQGIYARTDTLMEGFM